jgi:hypothetical protein
MAVFPLRPILSAGSAVVLAASLVALIWVYQWATHNTDGADYEHQRLVISTMIACAVLAAPVVVIRLLDPDATQPVLAVVRASATGAFIAVAAGAASTLLIAMAISPATDPGDFGRSLFPVAYTGALLISLGIGIGATWIAADRRTRSEAFASVVLCVVLVLVTAAYLAVGSSELNQCVAASEFPLDRGREHVCSGY